MQIYTSTALKSCSQQIELPSLHSLCVNETCINFLVVLLHINVHINCIGEQNAKCTVTQLIKFRLFLLSSMVPCCV